MKIIFNITNLFHFLYYFIFFLKIFFIFFYFIIEQSEDIYINLFKCDVYSLGKIFLELFYGKMIDNKEIYKKTSEEDLEKFIKSHSEGCDIYT